MSAFSGSPEYRVSTLKERCLSILERWRCPLRVCWCAHCLGRPGSKVGGAKEGAGDEKPEDTEPPRPPPPSPLPFPFPYAFERGTKRGFEALGIKRLGRATATGMPPHMPALKLLEPKPGECVAAAGFELSAERIAEGDPFRHLDELHAPPKAAKQR